MINISRSASKILTYGLYAALAAAGVYVFFRWLLPWLSPFLLAYALAAALEPAVAFLCRGGWKRGLASGLCTLAFFALAGGGLWLLASRLGTEIAELFQRLPEMLSGFAATLDRWQAWLARYLDGGPDFFREWFTKADGSLGDFLAGLPGLLSEKLLGLVSAFAAATPSVLLFSLTALIGVYFFSASFPDVTVFLKKCVPARFRDRARHIAAGLKRTLGRWLRAQLIMMLITFCELALAFALLGVGWPLALALLVAVIDALPVFGTGTVLIPWAIYALLTGDTGLGVGLAVTYGAVTIFRNLIQAKLIGDQLGLHPLVTLMSIYIGYRAWGVWGMLTFPILAITVKQLYDGGLFRLWKESNEGENYDRNHFQHHRGHGDEHSGRHEYPPW